MSTENNNLTELNNILFDCVRKATNKEMDLPLFNSIVNASNSITNIAKVQVQAAKMFKNQSLLTTFGTIPKAPIGIEDTDLYDQKHEFSIFKRYKSVADAISKMGKHEFETEFKQWMSK